MSVSDGWKFCSFSVILHSITFCVLFDVMSSSRSSSLVSSCEFRCLLMLLLKTLSLSSSASSPLPPPPLPPSASPSLPLPPPEATKTVQALQYSTGDVPLSTNKEFEIRGLKEGGVYRCLEPTECSSGRCGGSRESGTRPHRHQRSPPGQQPQ